MAKGKRKFHLIPWFFFSSVIYLSLCVPVLKASSNNSGQVTGHRKEELKNCTVCHEENYRESLRKKYIHQPLLQKRCTVCHSATIADEEQKAASTKTSNKKNKKIIWIGEDSSSTLEHWFLVPARKRGRNLLVEIKTGPDHSLSRELHIPPLKDATPNHDDHTPPVINNVRVAKIERGISISATIKWETDELSLSHVSYAISEIQSSTPIGNHLARQHEITLSGLKAGKEYKFTVTSQDVFGHESTSESFTLSTDQPLTSKKPPKERPPHGMEEPEEIELWTELIKRNGKYLVKLTANLPVTAMIGEIPGPPKPRRSANTKNNGTDTKTAQLPVNHIKLKDKLTISTFTCRDCHLGIKEVLSHPVNVYPKPGMIVPEEYPTLADGRISCMSCHARHASDNEYRLLKSSKKELCTGCHRDFI